MFRSILAVYPFAALNTRRIPCQPLPLYNPTPWTYIPVRFAASKASLELSCIEPLYLNHVSFISISPPSSKLLLGELLGTVTPLKNGLMSKDGFILRGALAPPNWNDLRLFDDQTQSGIHLVAPSDGSSWGILIVFCGSLSYGGCFQNLYRVDTPPNYRFLINNNEWSEWKTFS